MGHGSKGVSGSRHSAMRMGPTIVCTVAAAACAHSYQVVESIRDAVVVAGDERPTLSEPLREGQSLRFSWQVVSRAEPPRYLDVVTTQLLRSGVELRQRNVSSIQASRFVGGDVYRVRLNITSRDPTRAQVIVIAAPD
jgi:hypothetical protein